MTEQEWMVSEDPAKMLDQARGGMHSTFGGCRISSRKIRLFNVACCRQVWHLLADERSQKAVEVAERFADGQATDHERTDVRSRLPNPGDSNFVSSGSSLVVNLLMPDGLRQECVLGELLNNSVKICPECDGDGELVTSHRFTCYGCRGSGLVCGAGEGPLPYHAQASILRDIINPYLPLRCTGPNNPNGCSRTAGCAVYDTAIRPWQPQWAKYMPIMGGRIYLATLEAYESRDFSGLGIIADMLEDCNAANQPVLDHLRSPGPHYRGCWAVDLILGKE